MSLATRAIAEELSSLGAKVALCGRRVEPVTEVALALQAGGGRGHFVALACSLPARRSAATCLIDFWLSGASNWFLNACT